MATLIAIAGALRSTPREHGDTLFVRLNSVFLFSRLRELFLIGVNFTDAE
jgi:hypothetical protein